MNKKSMILNSLLILALASLGCDFGTQLLNSQDSPVLPEPAPTNSAQAVENVAAMVYDALAAGENLNPYINGVMTAFGVPPLGEADATLAGTRYDQGLPLMFIPQVAEMADAFNDGGFVSLDSFITAANSQGAKQPGANEPLTMRAKPNTNLARCCLPSYWHLAKRGLRAFHLKTPIRSGATVCSIRFSLRCCSIASLTPAPAPCLPNCCLQRALSFRMRT